MLVIGGVLDTQVPISDLYLLLSKGDVPKAAWINPQGGHLGRQVECGPIRDFPASDHSLVGAHARCQCAATNTSESGSSLRAGNYFAVAETGTEGCARPRPCRRSEYGC